MKRVVIFYFSGTGNTERVLRMLNKELVSSEVDVENIPIDDFLKKGITLPDLNKYDLIGLSYPIYGFGTPSIVDRFIEHFPPGGGRPLFIVKTGADFISINDNASTDLIIRLEEQGFDVFYDRVIVMPSNWIVEYDDALVKQLNNCAEKKAGHICADILSRKRRRYKTGGFIKSLSMGIARLEKKYGSRQFGASLRTDGSCNLCGLCVINCPVENIEQTEKGICFGSKCIWCMRCIYNCPVDSISSKGYNFCIIKGGYDMESVLKDQSIGSSYVTADTRGYFRHFFRYFNDDSL